jgi:Deoxynucleoside kinases
MISFRINFQLSTINSQPSTALYERRICFHFIIIIHPFAVLHNSYFASRQHPEKWNTIPEMTLIAVEGCVGAGKTTIARGLAGVRRSKLLIEDFSAVPFLEEFYRDPVGCALETEFAFLLQHYHQLRLAAREAGEFVSDFTFVKDLIFADMNIDDAAERAAFSNLHQLFSQRLPATRLTVFVSASDELILSRIEERGRSFELEADPSYYQRLNRGFEDFFASYPGPVFKLSADEIDFCRDPELFRWLSAEVDARLELTLS